MFGSLMDPAEAGLRQRYEAVARSVRDILAQRAGSAVDGDRQALVGDLASQAQRVVVLACAGAGQANVGALDAKAYHQV